MDDALLVCGFERLGDLPRNRQRFVERKGASRDSLRQRLAFDEFQHERADPVGLFDAVDAGDIRMIEQREDFSLALKSREALGIGRERVR